MRYLTILFATLGLLFSSCIENDIPLPLVRLDITDVKGGGFTVSEIDGTNRVITLRLDEATDIRHVRIDEVSFDVFIHSITIDKQTLIDQIRTSTPLTGVFDLRTPIYATLSLYQDYNWTIRAVQPIERRFTVAGQIGSTIFDVENRTATANIRKDADLKSVTVTSLKLGPADITQYSPTAAELSGSSFESVRFVEVTCHGITERWLLYVIPSETPVAITQAVAWSRVIWLEGSGIEGSETMGFRYRLASEDESQWKPVPNVTITGGSFSARLKVEANTQYAVEAFCDQYTSGAMTLTTQGTLPLNNGGFEEWSTSNDIVYPYLSGAEPYWGTGNPGGKIAGETLTDKGTPRPGSAGQYSADLQSKFANIAGAGKFAAGNIFTGTYVRTAGTNGILTFGRPFSLRPTTLRVWVKYKQGMIDKIKDMPLGSNLQLGDPDNGHIYIAMGRWTAAEYGKDKDGVMVGTADSPICIDTRATSTFFNPKGKDVVGYGELVLDKSVDEWQKVDIEIIYPDKTVAPTHMMIVCSASRWGDYFTGSTKSEMWLDDFELIYE